MSVRRIKRFVGKRLGNPPSDAIMLAEFVTPEELKIAARALRRAGYRDFDAHTPYPVHGMDQAMGLSRSVVPWLVLGAAFFGCAGAFYLQYWISAINYP